MQGNNKIESSFAKRAMQIGLILLGLIAALFIVFTPLAAGAADGPEGTSTVDDSVDDDANVPTDDPVGDEVPVQAPADDTSALNEESASGTAEGPTEEAEATDGDVAVPAEDNAATDDSADAGDSPAPSDSADADDSSAVTDESSKSEASKTEVLDAEEADGVTDMSTVVEKVDICHATSAKTNPYTANNVAVESIIQTPNGHNGHTGPVFTEGMTSGWGDIIPPFYYVENQGGETSYYPGMNWGAAGQAILGNGCNVTVVTTPPETTPPETTPPPTETPAEKVEICHATGSTSNPYVFINPAVESVIETPNGHNGHTGPVFTEGMTSGWGDIIPPFYYVENQGGETSYYPGMNWDEAGMAIFNNDCMVTVATTPPTTPPATTPPETTPPATTPPETTPPETTPETTPVTTKPATSESTPPKTEATESEEDSSNGLAQTGASLIPQVLAGSIVLLLAGAATLLAARRRQEQ